MNAVVDVVIGTFNAAVVFERFLRVNVGSITMYDIVTKSLSDFCLGHVCGAGCAFVLVCLLFVSDPRYSELWENSSAVFESLGHGPVSYTHLTLPTNREV